MKTMQFTALLLAFTAMVSCQKEDIASTYNSDPSAVKITAEVGSPFTRSNPIDDAASAAFKAGDAVVVAADDQNAVKYTFSGTAWTPETGKYLRWEADKMTFSAYHPVGVNNASMIAFDLPADQSSLALIEQADYMTYTSSAPEAKSENISLALTRKMARVVVSTTFNDQYATGYTVDKVEVHSNTNGYRDGAAKSGDITIAALKNADSKFYALLSPTRVGAAATFFIITVKKTADSSTETLIVKGIPALGAGKSYAYAVSVGKNVVKIADVIVSDWTDGGVIPGGEALGPDEWDGTYAADLSGFGTKESPYLIKTAEELALLSTGFYNQIAPTNRVYSYYKLMVDVDLKYREWTPIGSGLMIGMPVVDQSSFSGAFDGNGHTVYGLKVSATDDFTYAGLFGRLSPGHNDVTVPSIQNLTIEDAIIYAGTTSRSEDGSRGFMGAGILMGFATSRSVTIDGKPYVHTAKIRNCHVSGVIHRVKGTTAQYIGGLAGSVQVSEIEDCSANVTVDAEASCVGGLFGYMIDTSVKNSHSKGSIKGTWTMGGLAGGAESSTTINNCTTSVDVTSSDWQVGGFIGYMDATITDCSASGNVTSTINWPKSNIYKTGGFVGTNLGAAINCTYSGTLTYADHSADSWTYYGAFTGYHDGGSTVNCRFDGSKNPQLDESGLSWINAKPIIGSNDISNTLE